MSIDYKGDFDFSELEESLRAVLPDALREGGEFIGDMADLKTPVLVDVKRANKKRRTQVGALLRSRFVRADGNDVAVGYSIFWARWQHEREDYEHTVGEWKWLERAFHEWGGAALRRVADRIREGLK